VGNHQDITDSCWINQESRVAGFEIENRLYTINQAADDVLCTIYNHITDDFEIFEAKVKTKSDSGLILTAKRQIEE
jgi:hypothetical protein